MITIIKPFYCMTIQNNTNKLYKIILLCAILFLGCANKKHLNGSQTNSSISEIILGGDDQVMIIDYEKSVKGQKSITWQLKTSEIIDLPDSLHKYLKTVDDTKSVDNNKKILISSSSGAIVLVDRDTKRSLFYAIAPNAHSVEYLPKGRIAAALSTAKGGNSLVIYDVKISNKPLFVDSLYSGHGLTWDEKRKILYALGYDQLRAYTLKDWNGKSPKLRLEKEWTTPETGGHDLFQSSFNTLILSTSKAVWSFDLNREKFSAFVPIANQENVKSVYFDEQSGEIIYTKGEISWWTHQIHFLNPKKTIQVPEMKLYKIRVIKK